LGIGANLQTVSVFINALRRQQQPHNRIRLYC